MRQRPAMSDAATHAAAEQHRLFMHCLPSSSWTSCPAVPSGQVMLCCAALYNLSFPAGTWRVPLGSVQRTASPSSLKAAQAWLSMATPTCSSPPSSPGEFSNFPAGINTFLVCWAVPVCWSVPMCWAWPAHAQGPILTCYAQQSLHPALLAFTPRQACWAKPQSSTISPGKSSRGTDSTSRQR